MTFERRKRQRKSPAFAIIVTFLITAIILVSAKFIYDYLHHQWLLREHPLLFTQYVEKYADEYGLDKFLIYAVIKTESDFDSRAVSGVGARGLMQIMEETFGEISGTRHLNDEEATFDDMFNPAVNIRYGAHYISFHYDRFEDVDCALAAYFTGRSTVVGWLADPAISPDGRTLENIPSRNTQHYINKVNAAYEIYLKLYL
jgi:soluble lytic murein transglycosylase